MTCQFKVAIFTASLFMFIDSQLVFAVLIDAEHFAVDLPVNDVVYDHVRDVLYASVPSSAGTPHGNSIATIDPKTGTVISSTFIGSEPNTLAISDDASRVYVGIDGALSIRWWQPHDNAKGALRPLLIHSRFGHPTVPAVAHDLAVPPGRPDVVVVSVDEFGSTANGDLEVFDDHTSKMLSTGIPHPNYLGFVDASTLVGFDDSTTLFPAGVFELDNLTLNASFPRSNVIDAYPVEAEVGSDGLFYFSNGTVLHGDTLMPAGEYPVGLPIGQTLVEPVPALGLTYFVGPTGSDTMLKVFDSETFLELDAVSLPVSPTSTQDRGELIVAGEDRLAFLWKPIMFDGPGGTGVLHIVSGIPVSTVAEPSSIAFITIMALLYPIRTQRSFTHSRSGH